MEKKSDVKPALLLFTKQFPFGKAETYLESEILVIQNLFSRVYFLPSHISGENRIEMPSSFEVKSFDQNWSKKKNKILFQNAFFIFRVLLKEFLFVPSKLVFVRKINLYKNMLLHKIYVAEQLSEFIAGCGNKVVLCSYWFSDWATVLSVLKEKRKNISFVSRGHGYDIFDDRFDDAYIPFRCFQLSNVDAVYSVSKKGATYLRNKNINPENIKVSYLGVSDKGVNPFDPNARFTIVSCSNVNIFKRVDLIIDVLKNIDFPVDWVHFGDGDQLDYIKEKAKGLPSNIKTDFRGRVSNQEVMTFYLENSVNLFITTSAMEGLPMTLIEASSFGIPLMGTNVGGIPEIINDETGMLIEEKIDVNKVASDISSFRSSNKNTPEFRKGVRLFWENNFYSEKNYIELYTELINEFSFNQN
ncbi:MAG: glycosyltransferase [Bacteroidia bacterium]|nr:glycosyltransferase [Bacteroidia bacterium]